MEQATTDVDRMIRVYVRIRDARADLKKQFDVKDIEMKEQQEQIENALLDLSNQTGVTQLGAEHGTAYVETETQISIADDSAFYKFVEDGGHLDLLQRRVATNAVKQYIEDHKGAIPPGLNIFNRKRIKVRRK